MSGGYIWSTSEKSHMRAETANVLSMITASYGGEVEIDWIGKTVNFKFPAHVSKEDEIDCAEKCERVMLDAGFCV